MGEVQRDKPGYICGYVGTTKCVRRAAGTSLRRPGGNGGDKPTSFLLISDFNKIGDRGCQHINERLAASENSWHAYSSKHFRGLWCEGGGVQVEGAPGMDQLYIAGNSDQGNKVGVTGSRFLRGFSGYVSCDGEYKESQ